MAKLTFILSLVVLCANVVFGELCATPDGKKGQCVKLTECSELLTKTNNQNRTPEDLDLLQKSFCGKDGNMVKVCCPAAKCQTPENTEGDCISIFLCSHLTDKIKAPISSETRAYVASAICQSSVPFSICCGTTPPPITAIRSNICSNYTLPPDPSTGCCGREKRIPSRITSGEDTAIDQFPWMALIEYDRKNKKLNPLLCGGSLITARYVLTAAHCISPSAVAIAGPPKLVRLAEYDTRFDGPDCVKSEGGGSDCTKGVVKINIESYTPHPDYNVLARRNDIGLIRLEKDAPFDEFIIPICLPTSDITLNLPPTADLMFYVSGWGRINNETDFSPIKQYTNVSLVTTQECQAPYKQNGITLTSNIICAAGPNRQDSCKGDSGGPLMHEKDQVYEVTGVINFGPTHCGQPNFPGVYAKVYSYRDWILRTIR